VIDPTIRSTISRYFPLFTWMAFIFVASSGSFSASNTSSFIEPIFRWLFPNASEQSILFLHFLVRKAAHFFEYSLLGVLAAHAFGSSPKPAIRNRWLIVSAILVIVYALLDEYHQSFVPTRTASVFDSFVDIAGGITALLVIRRRRLKERSA
jgi:VanZ family protein